MTPPDQLHRDSAGSERSEYDVRRLAVVTMRQMGESEVLDAWVESIGGLAALPAWLTRCPCHDRWYDDCEAYR